MLANWVKETTATTGTGILTLAGAVSGFVSFANHPEIKDGATIQYVIESDAGREVGEGVFTASGTTLARTTILETLVSGTLDNTSPSALSLTGTSTVFISGNANNLFPKIGLYQTGIGNRGLVGFGLDVIGSSSTAMTANQMIFFPYIITDKINVASLGIEISTQGAASDVAKIGIYAHDGTNVPAELIYETTDIVVDSTGNKSHTTSPAFDLVAGVYWIAYVQEGATTRPKVFSGTTPQLHPIATDGKCYNLPRLTSVTSWEGAGSLPSSGSGAAFAGAGTLCPVVLIGV